MYTLAYNFDKVAMTFYKCYSCCQESMDNVGSFVKKYSSFIMHVIMYM